MLTIVAAAAALGLFGFAHCALMCGPLAVAGCRRESGVHALDVLRYQAGRLASYAFLGALFGVLGAHAAQRLSLDFVQRALLVLVAAAALVKGAALILGARRARRDLARIGTGPTARPRPALLPLIASVLPRRGLGLGLATGLLPCGMLAGAWAMAAASGHPLSGALVMTTFFVATTPALLVPLVAARPLARLRRSPALVGLLWCALGVWMGLRPLLDHLARQAQACH